MTYKKPSVGEVEDRLHVNVSERLITESSDGYFYTCYNLGTNKEKSCTEDQWKSKSNKYETTRKYSPDNL